MTLPTAFAAPVEAGIMFWWAQRPSRQALALGPSTVFWVAVYAWTVVCGEEGITPHVSDVPHVYVHSCTFPLIFIFILLVLVQLRN